MDRAAMTRLVYQRLADPGFRRLLHATAPDGTRPIIVVMPDDPILGLLHQVRAAGGSGNVVFPALNGVVVLTMEAASDATSTDIEGAEGDVTPSPLRSDSTVGVFLERLRLDVAFSGPAVSYEFIVEGTDERTERAEAKVVALAG